MWTASRSFLPTPRWSGRAGFITTGKQAQILILRRMEASKEILKRRRGVERVLYEKNRSPRESLPSEVRVMDCHKYIEGNLDHLPGKPKLIGRQYHTKGGIIDILAQDQNEDILVIEVKPGVVTPWACIQILRYCGAMIEQLQILKSDKKVKGLLIGRELDKHARLIFQALPPDRFQFISLEEFTPEV